MNELLTITANDRGALTVSTPDMATGLDIQHKNLIETIRTHKEVIERDFGLVAFETEPVKRAGERGTKRQSVAYLTEDQALFIGSLSRNSKRVVEFKSVLVQSFADARKKLLAASPSSEQALRQLISQQTQILSDNQQMFMQLRAEVDGILADRHPIQPTGRHMGSMHPHSYGGPPTNRLPAGSLLRQALLDRISEYCTYHRVTEEVTYHHLYRCFYNAYGINVHRLTRRAGESMVDTVERFGYLSRLYQLAKDELPCTE